VSLERAYKRTLPLAAFLPEFLLVSVEVRLGRPRPRAAYSGWFAMWSAEHARRTQRHPELVLLRCCLRLRYRHLVALKHLAGVDTYIPKLEQF